MFFRVYNFIEVMRHLFTHRNRKISSDFLTKRTYTKTMMGSLDTLHRPICFIDLYSFRVYATRHIYACDENDFYKILRF